MLWAVRTSQAEQTSNFNLKVSTCSIIYFNAVIRSDLTQQLFCFVLGLFIVQLSSHHSTIFNALNGHNGGHGAILANQTE